jgi:hypothetical protein
MNGASNWFGSEPGGLRDPSAARRRLVGRTNLSRSLVHGVRASAGAARSHLVPPEDVKQVLALPAPDRIVWLPIVLDVEEALHPLEELEVVLVLSLDELVHIDVALDVILLEGLLEDLVVLNIFVVVLGSPLDLCHGYSAREAGINDLTIKSTGSALLDLSELQLEEIVGPGQELSATHEERALHHTNSVRL